jgi:DNA-binding response OmpR family regulator
MKPNYSIRRIVLIDQQHYWRDLFSRALTSVGYLVCALDSYHYPIPHDCLQGANPDLVVLDCPQVDIAEQTLIRQILSHRHHLLVLCSSLSWQTMRTLFLEGADDVVEKPYNPEYFVHTVDQVLASITPLNSYQEVERSGV